MALRLTALLLFLCFVTESSGQQNACSRPKLDDNIELEGLQRYFSPGEELALSCKRGHTSVSGPRKIVCKADGEWTKTKLICVAKRCPYPDPLSNGEVEYTDNVYQSTINYTCHEGYTLTGASSAECLASGSWSASVPECKSVECGLAPIPRFGLIVYNKKVGGNTTAYGTQVTYMCKPPLALFGDSKAECTSNGTWTKTPECRAVTCPPPESIDRGYISKDAHRTYNYMETVKYGCLGDFVLEGSLETVCQQNGTWSEKPSCKAPCAVGIQRGRILYQSRKIWMKDLMPKKILHREILSVYCTDKVRRCGYAVPTQCIDGKIKIPECFEEPSVNDYELRSTSLPSEMVQC